MANVESSEPQQESAFASNELHLRPLTRILAIGGLASADLALLGWATHYVLTQRHALSFWGAAGCTGSVLVAALCGIAAANLIANPSAK